MFPCGFYRHEIAIIPCLQNPHGERGSVVPFGCLFSSFFPGQCVAKAKAGSNFCSVTRKWLFHVFHTVFCPEWTTMHMGQRLTVARSEPFHHFFALVVVLLWGPRGGLACVCVCCVGLRLFWGDSREALRQEAACKPQLETDRKGTLNGSTYCYTCCPEGWTQWD